MKTNFLTMAAMGCALCALNVSSNVWATDVRVCPSRTPDQQASLVSYFSSQLKANDPNADAVIPLVKEIFSGNQKKFSEMLDSGWNPNATIDLGTGLGYGMPLLYVAVAACRPSIAMELIHRGADVNGNATYRPLVNASDNGMDKLVEALLDHGASPEKEDGFGDTALWDAVAQSHYSTVKILLEHGANPNHAVHAGQSILGEKSIDSDDVKIAELLRSYGAVHEFGPRDMKDLIEQQK